MHLEKLDLFFEKLVFNGNFGKSQIEVKTYESIEELKNPEQ